MPRRLASIITLFFFVFISFFLIPTTYAATDPTPTPAQSKDLDAEMEKNGKMDKYLQEFCAKRQGNLMNLETWYSGKCPGKDAEFDSYSGEGVGFSDIVILDLVERVGGTKDPNKTFSQRLKEVFDTFKDNSPKAYVSSDEYQIAINNARQKLFFEGSDGLVAGAGKMISLLYRYPPASTGSYLAYVTQNLQNHKIIPPALAASTGVGFSTFSPFIELWKIVRNVAYFALILFFIVYGFMMMFRINLGQKTAITVQLAIPKLIVTLLVITFSYAIVGLIFDLMWVLVYFFIGYLQSQGLVFIVSLLGVKIWSPSYVAYGNSIFGFTGSVVVNSIIAGPAAVYGVLNLLFGGTLAAIAFLVGTFTGLNLLIYLIILIAVLISYGKLFVKLIGAFIYVVISLITGPILLLGNALPGSQAIGSWIRNIVANLFIFPVTMLFLLLSYLFMVQPLVDLCANGVDLASFLGLAGEKLIFCQHLFGVKNLVPSDVAKNITNIPLITPLGGFNSGGLLALVGVGLLLMAPKYVEMVRDALKVSPFKYGSALGDALKSTGSAAGGAYKTGVEGVKKVASMRGSGEEKPQSNTNQTENTQSAQTINPGPVGTYQAQSQPQPTRPPANNNPSPTPQTTTPPRPAEPTPAKPTPPPAPKA